ncbi:hypothetical protein [Sphingomonas aracearum]|uniref:hypothetical protein n=1 Tax=Sphingomonas aracearum TaxID=2283317 RepID=UPI0011C034A6|nr:hypothetical protein [Sphingomonas aracearum]
MHAVFDPNNSYLVGGWGLILTIVGLVISVLGFVITLWQIRRTKSATDSVSIALESFKTRLKHSDASVEAARVIKYFEKSIIYMRNHDWISASDSLWEGQSLLHRLKGDLEYTGGEDKLTDRNLQTFLESIQLLQDISSKGIKGFDSSDIIKSIRIQVNILEHTIVTAQKEVQNAQQ